MTDAPLGFWRIATEQPDRPALYADADGQTYTYGELHARANRMANGLRAMGLTTGDTVAVALPNTVQYFEVVLGCLQVGIYCTPINWHLVGPEIAYIVNDSDAQVFITDARFTPEATAARAEITLDDDRLFAVGDIDGYRSYDELTDGQSADPPAESHRGHDDALHVGHHRTAQGGQAGTGRDRPRRHVRPLHGLPEHVRHRAPR